MPTRKRSDVGSEDCASLCDELRQLREELAVLRASIDELREDLQHAVLNLGDRSEPAMQPFKITSMPLDPTCSDFAERLNRFTPADIPNEEGVIQRKWNDLQAAANAQDWNVVRRLGYVLLDHLGNGGDPPHVEGLTELSLDARREAAYDLALEIMQAALNAEPSPCPLHRPPGKTDGTTASGDQQGRLW